MASHPADRAALLKAFDESRTGVRGLVESGVSSVPDIFLHPDPYASIPLAPHGVSIPVVDLSLPAPQAAAAAAAAARSWGFFHLVNYQRLHLAPTSESDYPARALAAVRAFNELPGPQRAKHYRHASVGGAPGGVSYYSNVDLFRSPSASWRDTMDMHMGKADPASIPAACRAELLEWDAQATAVGRAVLGLLSQGLGLHATALEEASCLQVEGKVMVCHYYPVCPEPERTMGIVPHTDPGVVVVLAQDGVGGLQVKHADGEGRSQWVNVQPMPGALVVNVGDLLQIMSNDEYKSVEHRVVLNTHEEARVSIALFFNPGKREDTDFYGPLPELVSVENPAKYRNFTVTEFLETFMSRKLESKVLLEHFKL